MGGRSHPSDPPYDLQETGKGNVYQEQMFPAGIYRYTHTYTHTHKHSCFKPGVLALMDFPPQEPHGISGPGAREPGVTDGKCGTVGWRFGCHHTSADLSFLENGGCTAGEPVFPEDFKKGEGASDGQAKCMNTTSVLCPGL